MQPHPSNVLIVMQVISQCQVRVAVLCALVENLVTPPPASRAVIAPPAMSLPMAKQNA
jgi:hypothetical protein